MAWKVTEGNEYADVHSNSGEMTYGGNDSLCGGIPNPCDPYTNYTVKVELEESNGFDRFDSEYDCGNISKTITAKSCNQDMLVMWFNKGDNREYRNVLDDNSIFDIKNVDECEHIVISDKLHTGSQKFEDSSYVDSGYPCISLDPCDSSSSSGTCKYVAGVPYDGHKIKYHTTSDTIPEGFYTGHDELVELYFPHMYKSNEDGMNTKVIGNGAFASNTRLTAVTFSAVETIKNGAFSFCVKLENIDWGHYNCCKSQIKEIETLSFFGCAGLKKLCLDKLENIEVIEEVAFASCVNVNYFTLPTASTYSAITELCFGSIGADGDGIPEIIIPNNIKKIEENAFKGFKLVDGGKLDIGRGITSLSLIGDNAFYSENISPVSVRIKNVSDYDDIINNLSRIFDRTKMRIDFYIGDSSLAAMLNAYYSGGEPEWTFHALSEYPMDDLEFGDI